MSDKNKRISRLVDLSRTFTPGAPVVRLQNFAGRLELLSTVFRAISQAGQHVALFGDRGVGKTSLANVLGESFVQSGQPIRSLRVACSTTDTYETVWRRLFRKLKIELDDDQGITPAFVVEALDSLDFHPLLVVDEIDRFTDDEGLSLFADTIKALSDDVVRATIVVVGVSGSIESLIGDYLSVGRALIQIKVERMALKELRQIVESGLEQLGMKAPSDTAYRLAALSEGLPHYTHLLSYHAAEWAICDDRYELNAGDIRKAVHVAVAKAQDSIRSNYAKAIRSPRTDNLFEQVLLASALAEKDEVGFFTPRDVRDPLREILGRKVPISAYMRHLNEFSSEGHGNILQKRGAPRKWVFRFTDPMMQPYVVLRGVETGGISEDRVIGMREEENEDIVPNGL